jgi:hypothetical protein
LYEHFIREFFTKGPFVWRAFLFLKKGLYWTAINQDSRGVEDIYATVS